MRERLWLLFGLILGVSFAVQVAMPVDLAERPETSFETAPRGHAALFELLAGFDAVRGRWLSGLSMPPVEDTLWLIAGQGICDARGMWETDGEGARSERGRLEHASGDAPFRSTVEPWIEAGGTAIVWLSHPPISSDPVLEQESDAGSGETREVAQRRLGGLPAARGPGGGDSEFTPDDPDTEDAESIREGWHESLGSTRRELREGAASRCLGIAGHALPERRLLGLEGGELPIDAAFAATAFNVGAWVESRSDFDYDAVRTLSGPTLAFFERTSKALAGWKPIVIEADTFAPFAIARAVGDGHLIVIADSRVVTNARLGQLDAAPFVFDWIEAWGPPWIDEHRHGVVPESGAFRYLAKSPAWAACLGLLALGGLVIWRGNALPGRNVDEVDPEAPTLATFVESLAELYADTRDHARAFERYRALSLDRARRAMGLSPGTPTESVLASLRARSVSRVELRERGVRDLLIKDLEVHSSAEFERAAVRLDDLVRVLREENEIAGAARRTRT
jgi:hypothetical protein